MSKDKEKELKEEKEVIVEEFKKHEVFVKDVPKEKDIVIKSKLVKVKMFKSAECFIAKKFYKLDKGEEYEVDENVRQVLIESGKVIG